MIKERESMISDFKKLIQEKEWKYKNLLEAAEDMATALIELNPDSKFAQKVIQRFEEVRDGH
jgi:hypothetical protein